MRRLRIALIGSRGIPAAYGGYETLMEEISIRLARLGHDVTVYCRSHYTSRDISEFQGVRLVVLPTIRTKHLDTPAHTLLSSLHALTKRYDVALLVNAANAIFVPLLRLGGMPTALHVDGIEKRRAKWGLLGRTVYAVSERLACFLPTQVVTDAAAIRDHYLRSYGVQSRMITYGMDDREPAERRQLSRLGLQPRGYSLYVSRFEPENNPHRVVAAYARVPGRTPLVMVGDAPYSADFIGRMRGSADDRVLFPGAIYGEGFRELMANARAYVHATEVGGTHPALVAAMGYGNCVVVNDAVENREVAGDCAMYFEAANLDSLAKALDHVLSEPESAAALGRRAAERARRLFSWDAVAREYERLFLSLTGREPPPGPAA